MTEYALPCIVCGTELEALFAEHGIDNQPNHGVCFTSQGHYGSTIFDPMDGSMVEVNVCDTCMDHAAKMERVYVTRITRPVWLRNTHDPDGRIPYTIVGYEELSRPRLAWRPDLVGYPDTDRLQFESVTELRSAMADNSHIIVNLKLLKDIS